MPFAGAGFDKRILDASSETAVGMVEHHVERDAPSLHRFRDAANASVMPRLHADMDLEAGSDTHLLSAFGRPQVGRHDLLVGHDPARDIVSQNLYIQRLRTDMGRQPQMPIEQRFIIAYFSLARRCVNFAGRWRATSRRRRGASGETQNAQDSTIAIGRIEKLFFYISYVFICFVNAWSEAIR